MKLILRIRSSPAALGMAAILVAGPLSAATFTNELIDGGGNTWTQYTDIDIDALDLPHVAYTVEHAGGNATLWYAKHDGWNWSYVSRNVGPTIDYCSMELDSDGNPHFAVRGNVFPDYLLIYYKYDNLTGIWTTMIPDFPDVLTGDTLTGDWPDIAVNASDDPLISYGWKHDLLAATEGDLRMASRTAGVWTIETVDGGGDDVGYYTSIALHSSGRPRIAYYDKGNGNLEFARKTAGGTWARMTIDSLPDVGTWTDIAIDANDDVHISYVNETTRAVRYATNSSGVWVTEGVPDPNNAVGEGTSLWLDSDGDPHIAFFDTVGQKLRHVQKKAGIWTREFVDNSGDRGWRPALALDSNDEPHLSYFENATSDLYYASYATDVGVAGGLPAASSLSLTAYPNPTPAGAFVQVMYSLDAVRSEGIGSVVAAGPVDLAVYDITGRRIRSLVAGGSAAQSGSGMAGAATWDGRNERGRRAAPGVYFIRLDRVGETRTARVHLVR